MRMFSLILIKIFRENVYIYFIKRKMLVSLTLNVIDNSPCFNIWTTNLIDIKK